MYPAARGCEQFFRKSLEPGVYEMITSPQYKHAMAADKKTAMEEAALPIALEKYQEGVRRGHTSRGGNRFGCDPDPAIRLL
jgi:hypothetical protein